MTYDQVIEKVRGRGARFLTGQKGWEAGIVYDALNDAAREIAMKTKDAERTATLSLVAGTATYTISSAVAVDVDQILSIVMDWGTINPISPRGQNQDIFSENTEESDAIQDNPRTFRQWNGILKLYPIPASTESGTVYYTAKVPTSFYSTANGAVSVPLNDDDLNALIYEALSILAEGEGDVKMAAYYRAVSDKKLDDARVYRPQYDYKDSVRYFDIVSGSDV